MGSRREAVRAGAKPEKTPVSIDTTSPITTSPTENCIGNDGNARATAVHNSHDTTSPITPPTRQIATASIRNCIRIVRLRAPTALRVPISRVRSFTLT